MIVPAFGPQPSPLLIIGEAPGENEAREGRPFVGRAGKLQQHLLSRNSVLQSWFRLANIYPVYKSGNPDPTPSDIAEFDAYTQAEIHTTAPSLIVAVGRFAARYFLGDSADMEIIHGIPQCAGSLDTTLIHRAPAGCIILPVYHPASTFYGEEEERSRSRLRVYWDYEQVTTFVKLIRTGRKIEIDAIYPFDPYAGRETYLDLTGIQLSSLISHALSVGDISELGIDTEDDDWIQVSWSDGTGYVLRATQPDFAIGISAIQRVVDSGIEIITHCADTPRGCLYDIWRCREMGLELRRANLFDTMYNLMLYRVEPKGLKPASYRHCGIRLSPYEQTIGDIGREKQIAYLEAILARASEWPKPNRELIYDNDGTTRFYQPSHVAKTVAGILRDIASGKLDKDDKLTDPYKRWYGICKSEHPSIARNIRRPVEAVLGRMPIGSLVDIPLTDAVHYAGADPDATRRLALVLKARNRLFGLESTMSTAMTTIPMFEEMQSNGMPAVRSSLISLRESMSNKMSELGLVLSADYFEGAPFNPNSPPQVRELLKLRNLKPAKRTPTGEMSTGKKSIEQYRYRDPAIGLMFDWRERSHIRDSFCEPLLETFPEDPSITHHDVTTFLRIAHTESRRLASEDPNLLNIPVRTEEGLMVRACFVAPNGYVFVAADLSQIELRCLAHDSDSRFLIEKFRAGADIHTETAMAMTGKRREDITKADRDPAKTINFGIVYGQQKWGLFDQFRMRGIDWPMDKCEEWRSAVLKLLGIDDYIKRVVNESRRAGVVRDVSGMPHYLPALDSDDMKLRAEAERQVISYRIQPFAQWMLQQSMAYLNPIIWRMQDEGKDVRPRLQIHDELDFTCREDEAEELKDVMLDAMTNHCGVKLKVPVLAEAKIAKSWDKLK